MAQEQRPTSEALTENPAGASRNMITVPTDSGREARRRAQACVVVVRNGGRWTRAVYLSLHSANQAVDRARARGADPYLVLVELVPVGEVQQ